METTIRPKNFKLAPDIEEQVQKRIERLTRHLDNLTSAEVIVSQQPARHTANRFQYVTQVTLHTRQGDLIRSEVSHTELLTAIDQCMAHLGRQIDRFKARYDRRRKGTTGIGKMSPPASQPATDEPSVVEMAAPARPTNDDGSRPGTKEIPTNGSPTEDDLGSIVRVKTFSFKPIFPEDAIEQMELLGHSFFVFWNASDERVNVIYRRNDGNYGLIQPEFG
ncbi:MAG TPA: ribosome-associated translation inhibitor RaiA [Chloroflexia bacterium]|nr:ribosome-associated translation inhibitor RaiA [Chloroflexia bacterium]